MYSSFLNRGSFHLVSPLIHLRIAPDVGFSACPGVSGRVNLFYGLLNCVFHKDLPNVMDKRTVNRF